MKNILKVFLVLLLGLAGAIAGLLAGMLIGGNFFTEFQLFGVQGYEATGQVGFYLGAALGLLAGWNYLLRRK